MRGKVDVSVGVGVLVGVFVGVEVAVEMGVFVGVAVAVLVGVEVGVCVGVAVCTGAGAGASPLITRGKCTATVGVTVPLAGSPWPAMPEAAMRMQATARIISNPGLALPEIVIAASLCPPGRHACTGQSVTSVSYLWLTRPAGLPSVVDGRVPILVADAVPCGYLADMPTRQGVEFVTVATSHVGCTTCAIRAIPYTRCDVVPLWLRCWCWCFCG